MKITENYFVIRSSLVKKYVYFAHHCTVTKSLKAAQRYEALEDAQQALQSFKDGMLKNATDRYESNKPESSNGWVEREFTRDQQVIESFKIHSAERVFELKAEE